jgi:hypothetical protein
MEPLATDDPTHTANMDIYRILVCERTKGDDVDDCLSATRDGVSGNQPVRALMRWCHLLLRRPRLY